MLLVEMEKTPNVGIIQDSVMWDVIEGCQLLSAFIVDCIGIFVGTIPRRVSHDETFNFESVNVFAPTHVEHHGTTRDNEQTVFSTVSSTDQVVTHFIHPFLYVHVPLTLLFLSAGSNDLEWTSRSNGLARLEAWECRHRRNLLHAGPCHFERKSSRLSIY